MTRQIDPVALARFMLMSGASELVTAFAAIPEGPLRDSVVHHAQVIAATYANPPQHAAPDPLHRIAPDPVAALSGPRRGTPATDDPQVKAVQLMLEGVPPSEAAARTGLDVNAVLAAKKAAKSAGVSFPNLKASKKPKGTVNFPVELEGLDDRATAVMARAATTRGIDLPTYMGRRKLALSMALEGRHIRAIMEATKESKATLTSWFTTARTAGLDVPYMVDTAPAHFEEASQPGPAPEPEAEVTDLSERRKPDRSAFPLHETELDTAIRRKAIEQGAALMNLTVQEFLAKRRQAVSLFTEGKSPAAVSRALGITLKQAQNWRTRAITAGRLRIAKRPPPRSEPTAPPSPAPQHRATGATNFAVTMEQLTARGRIGAEATARTLKVTLQELMEKRFVAVQAFAEGATGAEVGRRVGVPTKMADNWKTTARQAGLLESVTAPQKAEA